MPFEYPQRPGTTALPGELAKDLDIQIDHGTGEWETVHRIRNNRKRLLELPETFRAEGVRIKLLSGWSEAIDPRLFSVDVLPKGQDDTFQPSPGPRWKDVVARTDPEDLKDPDTLAKGNSPKKGGHAA
jgi:hypothetical protein